MVPKPVITPSVYGRLSSRPQPWARCLASMSSSWKDPSSRRYSIRSRAVIWPWACWRATARADPACLASSRRAVSSSRRWVIECSAMSGRLQARVWAMPIEPAPSSWRFPRPGAAADRHRRVGSGRLVDDVVAVGADLEPGTLLAAYRNGLFPMPLDRPGRRSVMAWRSPDPRAILPLDGMHVSRSLARRLRQGRFRVTLNAAFADVIAGCADREDTWITPTLRAAYVRLHRLGWAHSVEVWAADGKLA